MVVCATAKTVSASVLALGGLHEKAVPFLFIMLSSCVLDSLSREHAELQSTFDRFIYPQLLKTKFYSVPINQIPTAGFILKAITHALPHS